MIIKDKKQKRELDKVPDKDKNGDPIFKMASTEKGSSRGDRKDKKSK